MILDTITLQVLNTLRDLIRPKRFMATLILGIATLISILTTFAIATTALIQEIHTTHYINTLNKNITSTLLRQTTINNKLKTKINILKK